MAMEIKEIKIKDLKVDKYNARGGEWIHDEKLVESIKAMGVLEPLLVRKLKKGYGIICGSRRFNASINAKLKSVPCVIRGTMTDLEALGTSLQENLARNSLDAVQESEAIADLWEMINGGSTEKDKIKKMKDMFGLSERSIYRYLQISRLSDTIKSFLKPSATRGGDDKSVEIEPARLDIATASSLESSNWEEEEQEEVAEILTEIASPTDRRKVLSEMKKYDEEDTPAEAFNKVKHIAKITSYSWRPNNIWINKAMDKAGKKWALDYNGIIEKCLTSTSNLKNFKK